MKFWAHQVPNPQTIRGWEKILEQYLSLYALPSSCIFPMVAAIPHGWRQNMAYAVKWTFNLIRYDCHYILSNVKPQFHQIELFSVKPSLKTSQSYTPNSSQALSQSCWLFVAMKQLGLHDEVGRNPFNYSILEHLILWNHTFRIHQQTKAKGQAAGI